MSKPETPHSFDARVDGEPVKLRLRDKSDMKRVKAMAFVDGIDVSLDELKVTWRVSKKINPEKDRALVLVRGSTEDEVYSVFSFSVPSDFDFDRNVLAAKDFADRVDFFERVVVPAAVDDFDDEFDMGEFPDDDAAFVSPPRNGNRTPLDSTSPPPPTSDPPSPVRRNDDENVRENVVDEKTTKIVDDEQRTKIVVDEKKGDAAVVVEKKGDAAVVVEKKGDAAVVVVADEKAEEEENLPPTTVVELIVDAKKTKRPNPRSRKSEPKRARRREIVEEEYDDDDEDGGGVVGEEDRARATKRAIDCAVAVLASVPTERLIGDVLQELGDIYRRAERRRIEIEAVR